MDNIKKLRLEERNKQIINAILTKIEKECPGCVDLIGISGSFFTGDIHEKSDLDLLIIINDDKAKCRYSSALFLNYLEFSLYMLNKKIVKYGVKRIPQEIENMPILPVNFIKLHNNVVCSESVSEIKASCTELLKITRKCFKDFENNAKERKDITAEDLAGTYEEIYSNWLSKMFHSIDINSPYLSFQTLSSCQNFYNMMSEKFNINNINIMKNFIPSDLKVTKEYFIKGMEEYLELYTKLNVNVKNYQTIEDFEKEYLYWTELEVNKNGY